MIGARQTKRRSGQRSARSLLKVALPGAVLALLAYALWWRRNPSACPYALRFFVELPHPFITRARLREIHGRLDPDGVIRRPSTVT